MREGVWEEGMEYRQTEGAQTKGKCLQLQNT